MRQLLALLFALGSYSSFAARDYIRKQMSVELTRKEAWEDQDFIKHVEMKVVYSSDFTYCGFQILEFENGKPQPCQITTVTDPEYRFDHVVLSIQPDVAEKVFRELEVLKTGSKLTSGVPKRFSKRLCYSGPCYVYVEGVLIHLTPVSRTKLEAKALSPVYLTESPEESYQMRVISFQ